MKTTRHTRFSFTIIATLVLLTALFLANCGGGGGGDSATTTTTATTYTVTYDGNGNTGGSVPADTTAYEARTTVTILGDTGGLVKTGYSFAGWNTLSNGTGTTYVQSQTFLMGPANVTLYAQWAAAPPMISLGHTLDANTVALWRFDEASVTANVADETGAYELTQYGNPAVYVGRIDNSRLLNGSSRYFQRAGDAILGDIFTNDWTYEAWINLDPAFSAQGELLIYNGPDFSAIDSDTILAEVGVLANRKIYWHQWQNTGSYTEITSSAILQTGRFYHIAVSRSGQGMNLFTYRIYINGVLDTVTTDVAGLDYIVDGDTHTLGLGCVISGSGTAGNVLNGRVDDTRISKITRTEAEVLESYQRRGPLFTSNGDGTIIDNRTGLVWIASPDSTTRTWSMSDYDSQALDFAGNADWRLPAYDELSGLIQDWTGASPAAWLASQGFSNVQPIFYWSITTDATFTNKADTVHMGDGAGYLEPKSLSYLMWPVRSGRQGPLFIDNGDGTMIDSRSGLMWVKSPSSTTRDWQTSIDYCSALDFPTGVYGDWRLPTETELSALLQDWTGASPVAWLSSQGFSNVQGNFYWSSTESAGFPTYADTVNMGDGWGYSELKTISSYYAWPVRP